MLKYFLFFLLTTSFGIFISFAQPLQNHILLAISEDGIHFRRENLVVVYSGDVPDAIIGPEGNVYLYFQGLLTLKVDGIMVGISQDGKTNWVFNKVNILGTENWFGRPCDPDVIFQNDTFRLYFTGDPMNDMEPKTYSAISTDGINFTLEEGVRFGVEFKPILDPSLLWTDSVFQYFAGGAPGNSNWHAHSVDGVHFNQQPDFYLDKMMMANGIKVPNGYRFYCFKNYPENGIFSIFSSDGENWEIEPGFRLTYDGTSPLEKLYVKDPAIVLKDGNYLMYYVTRKSSTSNNDEISINNEPKLSFNPWDGNVVVSISPLLGLNLVVELFDFLGRQIFYFFDGTSNIEETKIKLKQDCISTGSYFLKIFVGDKQYIFKIFVVK